MATAHRCRRTSAPSDSFERQPRAVMGFHRSLSEPQLCSDVAYLGLRCRGYLATVCLPAAFKGSRAEAEGEISDSSAKDPA